MSFTDFIPTIFNANAKPGEPLSYAALQTRRRIAEQLMGKRSPFPKTIGEGLTYLGEALGDRMQMSRLDEAERAREAGLTDIERRAPAAGVTTGGSDVGAASPTQPAVEAGGDVGDTPARFANVRYNNPGAQYPVGGENAAAFAQQGAGIIGGGHKIAQFPTPVHGAAANMDLLDRNYTGMPIGAAINKWSGGGRRNVPGFDTDTVITKDMMRDPAFAIPFMQAVAGGEAPGRYPMSGDQWAQAHNMFTGVRGGGTPVPLPPADPRNRVTQALMSQGGEAPAEPAPPTQTAALLPPGVASDAGPQAALPPNPPIPTDIKPMPTQVAQATQTGPAIPQLPANTPPEYQREKPVPPPVPEERPKNARELYGERILAEGIRQGDPQKQAMGQDYINREKTVRDHLYARDVEAYKAKYAHFSALDTAYEAWQQGRAKSTLELNKAAHELGVLPQQLAQGLTKQDIENRQKALELRQATPPETPVAPPGGTIDPRLGTPQSPQRSGTPNIPPTPFGTAPKEWAEKQVPEMVKAVSAYEKAVPDFAEAIRTLQLAREHPGRKTGVGFFSEAAKRIPGTEAYDFGAIMDQIGGKNFLTAYQQLKGGGAITEIEGTKAEAAQARLKTAQSPEGFDKSLNDFEIALRTDLERAQRKVNQPVTAWRKAGDNSSTAPDIGERRGNMEYIGGNPGVRESWRAVR